MLDSARVKRRLESIPARTWLIKEAGDPVVAFFLWLSLLSTLVALWKAPQLFPGDRQPRSEVLQLAGGALVLLSAYFAANRFDIQRGQQRTEMLREFLQQVGSGNAVARVSAIRLIQSTLEELPCTPASTRQLLGYEPAIRGALEASRLEQHRDDATESARQDLIVFLDSERAKRSPPAV